MEPDNTQLMSRQKPNLKLKDWDEHLLKFLEMAGLHQAARGFKLDVMVMNQHSEKQLMVALEQLCAAVAGKAPEVPRGEDEEDSPNPSLDEMKQKYLPTGNTKAISRFLSDVRARVDQSNRDEFVQRKHPGKGSARTDAIKLNRDVQMKYDVVKNEDGPLGKTMKAVDFSKPPVSAADKSSGVTERFQAIEAHLGVRYVPGPPADYMLRVKHIEDHIIRLEREYPPWAALHFNQPNRGWPPPPRDSIIVIPPHLTSSTPASVSGLDAKGKHRAGKESSLLRAALDKLEVQKALDGQL
ncbi:unnamed protein product [Rhizoctonia solani]|uniref:Uncharacterized protein n=1 Tax=Rhizoctonia solani TaxID=456999 RepID=A0A8H3GH74_9AGAM|nr:unnamed protein product [Rhizoctonia solani]